ncbi:hypothetical protein OTU49_003222, partial [Cherax quadricarinatus]
HGGPTGTRELPDAYGAPKPNDIIIGGGYDSPTGSLPAPTGHHPVPTGHHSAPTEHHPAPTAPRHAPTGPQGFPTGSDSGSEASSYVSYDPSVTGHCKHKHNLFSKTLQDTVLKW